MRSAELRRTAFAAPAGRTRVPNPNRDAPPSLTTSKRHRSSAGPSDGLNFGREQSYSGNHTKSHHHPRSRKPRRGPAAMSPSGDDRSRSDGRRSPLALPAAQAIVAHASRIAFSGSDPLAESPDTHAPANQADPCPNDSPDSIGFLAAFENRRCSRPPQRCSVDLIRYTQPTRLLIADRLTFLHCRQTAVKCFAAIQMKTHFLPLDVFVISACSKLARVVSAERGRSNNRIAETQARLRTIATNSNAAQAGETRNGPLCRTGGRHRLCGPVR